MSLIRYEFKKIASYRMLWILLALLLVANAVIGYYTSYRVALWRVAENIRVDYEKDPQSVLDYYGELMKVYEEYSQRKTEWMQNGRRGEEPKLDLPNTYGYDDRFDDRRSIARFLEQREYALSYSGDVEKMAVAAHESKEDLLSAYYWIDEDSYACRRLSLMENSYLNVLEKAQRAENISDEEGRSWNQVLKHGESNVFILIIVMAGAGLIFLSEFGPASLLLHSQPRGRLHTAAAKLCVLFVLVCVTVVLFTLSTILGVGIKCGGMSDIGAMLGVFSDFRATPCAWTVGESVLVALFVRIAVFSIIAFFTAALCLLFRNVPLGFFASFAVVAAQFALYMTADSPMMKYLNLVGMVMFYPLVEDFRCFAIENFAVGYIQYAAVILPLLLAGLSAAVLAGFSFARLGVGARIPRLSGAIQPRTDKKTGKKRRPSRAGRRLRSPLFVGIFSGEVRKSLLSFSVIILIAVCCAGRVWLMRNSYSTSRTLTDAMVLEYMNELEGEVSDEKFDDISSKVKEISSTKNAMTDVREGYFAGTITKEEYSEYWKNYQYAVEHEDAMNRVNRHGMYLRQIEKREQSPWFFFDYDWEKVCCTGVDIILVALLVFICSGVFADEYRKVGSRGSMAELLRSTRRGRGQLFASKLVFVFIISAVFALAFTLTELYFIQKYCYLPAGDAPLVSMEMFVNTTGEFTVGDYVKIMFVERAIAVVVVALAVALLGMFIKNKLFLLCVSALAVFAPVALAGLGVSAVMYIFPVGALSFTDLYLGSTSLHVGGDWGYIYIYFAVYTALAVLLAVMARRKYCK